MWSARILLDDPAEIAAVHRAYLRAGADCITTASYQASEPGLARAGLDADAATRVLQLSVRIACEERNRHHLQSGRPDALRPLVAASVGPWGAWLADGSEYTGQYDVSRSELRAFHRERLRALAAAGPDLIVFETIPNGLEAEVLLELLDEVPDHWAWLSLSCRDGGHLVDGSPLADIARRASRRARMAAVGVNCTHPRNVPGMLRTLAAESGVPIAVYPNSGEDYDPENKCWTGQHETDEWLDHCRSWRASGARVLGGCCRVGPEAIATLNRAWPLT